MVWRLKKNIIRTKDPDTSHNYTLEIRGMYIPIYVVYSCRITYITLHVIGNKVIMAYTNPSSLF